MNAFIAEKQSKFSGKPGEGERVWLLGMPDWPISVRIRPVKHLNLRLVCIRENGIVEELIQDMGYTVARLDQLEIMPFERC